MSNLELSDLPISYLRGHNELTQKFFKAIKDLDNKVVAQMLANNPHLIVTKNKNGLTPLLSAAKYNNEVAFKLLLDHNACVHATTKSGKGIIELTTNEQIIAMLHEAKNMHIDNAANHNPPLTFLELCSQRCKELHKSLMDHIWGKRELSSDDIGEHAHLRFDDDNLQIEMKNIGDIHLDLNEAG